MVYYSSWFLYCQNFDIQDWFFGQVGNIAICLKKNHKKWVAFAFGSVYIQQTFTEFVSNQYTHKLWYIDKPDVTASYWTLFDFIVFLGIFIHYYWPIMSQHFNKKYKFIQLVVLIYN